MIKKQKDNIAGKRNERRKKKKKPIFNFQHIESLITSLSH
jgi:hypothetical protein